MTLPDFHTFREMLEHLQTGGAAFRYGSNYPIYCTRKYGEHSVLEKRMWGGSSGENVQGTFGGEGIHFSSDEQHSINWVFISKADWDKRDQNMRDAWTRIAEENAKRQRETGKFEGKVGQTTPEPIGWWKRLVG